MKTEVIKEQPLITLMSSCYNGRAYEDVYAADLRAANVGDRFYADYNGCGRDVYDETLTVVYKDSNGVACTLHTYRTSDDPNPTDWEEDVELKWFELKGGV